MNPESKGTGIFAGAAGLRMAWLCGVLLVAAAAALNMRVLGFGFLYLRDDDLNVALNPHMGALGAGRLAWMFTDWSYVRRYIPLGWLGFSATYQFAGLDPRPYHAAGLGLYAINTALVFVLVLHVLRLVAPGPRAGGLSSWDAGAAALAAGWWAFSPMRVETTAWVSGNLYGQSMALLFVSLIAYLRTCRPPGPGRTAWLCLSAAAYAASLLTYPLALGVPVLLIGLDWLQARGRPAPHFRRLLAEKAAFVLPLAAVLAVTMAARVGSAEVYGTVPGLRESPLLGRAAQSAYVAAYYVWKPFWPAHLSPLYDTLVGFNPAGPVFLLCMAAVAAVSAFALATFRARPLFAVVWFGYLAAAAPFFGLTERNHMASDRYAYFLAVIAAAVIAALLARAATPRGRTVAAAASLAVLVVLCRLTARQLDSWTDDRVQHAYVAAHLTNPELLDDFNSRLEILEFMRGHEVEAEAAVAAALARNPSSPGFRKAAGMFEDKRKVAAFYGGASLLAILQDQMGLRFARAGEYREANDHFEDALRMDDRFYQAAFDRALVLLDLGRARDALGSYMLAQRWASPALTRAQVAGFLGRLESVAKAGGDTLLAGAARRALER
jgi:tetratricopeptide (TPR) repeat protein